MQNINLTTISANLIWPEGLSIRARVFTDAPEIAWLHNLPGYRYGTLRTPYHSPEDVAKAIQTQNSNGYYLVALIDGRIVGDLGLTPFANRRAHVGSIGMGVHDHYVARGIGTALLGEAISIADNWLNLKRLELTVFTDNKPALNLYERFGFAIEGTMQDFAFRDGRFVDAYSMARFR